jgi:AraC-like DNA-binding protein
MVQEKLCGTAHRHSLREARLESIMAIVDLEMSNPDLSLSEVAHRCRISERYLCKLMRESGETFAQALRRKRLARAREWLIAPEKRHLSVGEVAQLTGYRSGAQFSRAFRAHCGCTPREMRAAGHQPFASQETARPGRTPIA